MPTLVLLAGPNGDGKTTFINRFLRQRAEAFRFVNPDEVARGLTGEGSARDLAAGPRVKLEGDVAGAGAAAGSVRGSHRRRAGDGLGHPLPRRAHPLPFRHPPASRVAAQTGGTSGAQ